MATFNMKPRTHKQQKNLDAIMAEHLPRPPQHLMVQADHKDWHRAVAAIRTELESAYDAGLAKGTLMTTEVVDEMCLAAIVDDRNKIYKRIEQFVENHTLTRSLTRYFKDLNYSLTETKKINNEDHE